MRQRGTRLFDKGNEGNDGSGSKTLNCYCSLKEKDGDNVFAAGSTKKAWHMRSLSIFGTH
jgi:hypothetical protein